MSSILSSFYRSQNILVQSKCFVLDQKLNCIQCHSIDFVLVLKLNLMMHKSSFGLVPKIWTCKNYFWICKSTRNLQFNFTTKSVIDYYSTLCNQHSKQVMFSRHLFAFPSFNITTATLFLNYFKHQTAFFGYDILQLLQKISL